MQVCIFILAGQGNAVSRKVDPCDVKSFFRQYAGMTSPAAGDIQHQGTGRGHESVYQAGDKGGGLLFVVLKIEFMIIWGIKPIPEPLGRNFHAALYLSKIKRNEQYMKGFAGKMCIFNK